MNTEKACELSKQIAAMKASIEELKLASGQAQEAQAKAMAEKEAQLGNYKNAQEEAAKRLISLKKEYDPEQTRDLEAKLAETSAEIEILQEEMKKAHASEMDTVRGVTSELNEATKALQNVAEEESNLRNLVSSLRMELEQVKSEQDNLKEKEKAAEILAARLSGELENSKITESEKVSMDVVDELTMKIQQLSSETKNSRKEAEEKSKKAQELRQEAKTAQAKAEEAEKKLAIALKEAEDAKAAQKRALQEMRILSDMQGGTDVAKSEHSGKIKLSVEEFEALSRKAKECEDLVEKTEAAAIAQVKDINTRKNEADKKVEANLKAIEEIETATDIALKNAEMAESAKLVVEGELRRWRQQEHKVASEASSQILEDSDKSAREISFGF